MPVEALSWICTCSECCDYEESARMEGKADFVERLKSDGWEFCGYIRNEVFDERKAYCPRCMAAEEAKTDADTR